MSVHSNIHHEKVLLYEVIRVIEGIPIFLENHLDRLYHSACLTGMNAHPVPATLAGMIKSYIKTQNKDTGNIKLSFSFSDASAEPQCELNFIPHYYPTREEYSNGIKVGLIYADRPIPNAKIQDNDIRERANDSIKENSLFEVLLIDSEGNITEGSRSNVFFIKNDILYSSPGEKILRGITWIKVLQICKTAGIRVIESAIPADKLDQYEAAFITGTSTKILPISSIDQLVYKTDLPLLSRLQDMYDQLIDNYIQENR